MNDGMKEHLRGGLIVAAFLLIGWLIIAALTHVF